MAEASITTDAGTLAATLAAGAQKLTVRVSTVVRHHGTLLQARVKAHMAGRPGPRQITGDLNRSIALDVGASDGGSIEARVGTNRPQGRRLEFGFTGRDSLGRSYSQPPYPAFIPALQETVPGFEQAMADVVDQVL